MAHLLYPLLIGFLGVGAPSALDDDEQPSADLKAVNRSADVFRDAYNNSDAKTIAGMFTTSGEFVDSEGNVFHGRDAIEKEYAAFFEASPKSTITIDVESVRFVSDGLLIEEGVSTITPKDELPASKNTYVVVHVKQNDGKWLIASTRVGKSTVLSPHEHLEPLAWLVGEWVDESQDSVVETSWHWSDDGNFLMSKFEVKVEGRPVIRGAQRLGWDPERRQVRSWTFDESGSFGQGFWTLTEDGWVVKSTAVRSDGERASATNVFSPVNNDSFVWVSKDRIAAGERQEDFMVQVVRKAPAPNTAASNE